MPSGTEKGSAPRNTSKSVSLSYTANLWSWTSTVNNASSTTGSSSTVSTPPFSHTSTIPATPSQSVLGTLRDVTAEVWAALSDAASYARTMRWQVMTAPNYLQPLGEIQLYVTFFLMVNHGAPWDIKRAESWEKTIGTTFPGKDVPIIYKGMVMTVESLGNYTYGFLGACFEFPLPILITGSYVAAGFPTEGAKLYNEFRDWYAITTGFSHGVLWIQ